MYFEKKTCAFVLIITAVRIGVRLKGPKKTSSCIHLRCGQLFLHRQQIYLSGKCQIIWLTCTGPQGRLTCTSCAKKSVESCWGILCQEARLLILSRPRPICAPMRDLCLFQATSAHWPETIQSTIYTGCIRCTFVRLFAVTHRYLISTLNYGQKKIRRCR